MSLLQNTHSTKILYRSNLDEFLHILEIDGSKDKRLVKMTPVHDVFEWFPDGSKIVFSDKEDNIYTMNIYSIKNNRRITLLEDSVHHFRHFFVFQDMSKIVFSASEGLDKAAIGIINTDGSGFHILPDYEMICYEPIWCSLHNKIIFQGLVDTNYDIYSMNIDGTDLKNLTNNPDFDGYAVLSPDFELLTYVSIRNGKYCLYTMDANGSDQRLLVEADGNVAYIRDPQWSPDGKQITFIKRPSNTFQPQIFVINKDGSSLKQLSNESLGALYNPQWDPDGNKLYFSSNDGGFNILRIDVTGKNRQRILYQESASSWIFKVSPQKSE